MRLAPAVACALALTVLPAVPARAADGPALAVDVAAGRYPISPDVYGVNFADDALQTELGLTADRWGGNTTSRYNWTNNTHNTGEDWYFENIVDGPAGPLDAKVADDLARGVRPVVTVPMLGWVAKTSPATHPFACGFKVSKYGAQTDTDPWDPDCGNGVKAAGGHVTGNDPLDTSVAAGPAFVKEMVAHLVATHGSAATTGVRTYELDNEPSLWDDTHRDVHPAPVTYDVLRDKSVATAKAIKEADPGAAVMGPSEWGWCAYFFSPADPDGCADGPDRQAHGGTPMAQWYLGEMKKASDTAGVRLLDVFDEHYYPQARDVALAPAGSTETQALRLRSTRSLWDPGYQDESWIGAGGVGAGPIRLIPWMRGLVAEKFPGTRTAISEYNWGALDHLNGALAQADVLGIFGRERLDAAMLWGATDTDEPWAYAFRMYRGYDGAGGRFGETSVGASSADQGRLAVYAAERAADRAVTVMVVNKTAGELTAPVALSGAAFGPAAQVWRYSGANLGAIQRAADQPVGAGGFTATLPGHSITLFVLPTVTADPLPAAASVAVTPAKVVYGQYVTATGRLVSGGTPVAGRVVRLEARRKGATAWTSLGTATTAADGRLAKRFPPKWSAALRWRWAGDAAYAAATSPAVAVSVAGRVGTALSPASMRLGGTAKVSGSVAPAHPYGRYALQRYDAGYGWRTVATAALSSASTYARYLKPSAKGTYSYRVRWLGDTDHAANNGPTVRLTVT